MSQPGFFDLESRHKKLNEKDPLLALNQLIDWENFRDTLNKVRDIARKSNAGRKPYDVVLMFKILVLQHLYNVSDDEIEYQIRDRYSFCRFLGLYPEQTVPDAKTKAVSALKGLNLKVIAAGDSYNDTGMLKEANAGILFRAPENVVEEFPQFPVTWTYEEFKTAIIEANKQLEDNII